MLAWLAAKSEDARVDRRKIPKELVYSERVRADLASCGFPERTATSSPDDWEAELAPFSQTVLCLVFIKPAHVASAVEILTSSARASADYWLGTKWGSNPLILLEFIGVLAVRSTVTFRGKIGFPATSAFFSSMTHMCVEAACDSIGMDELSAALMSWGFDSASYMENGILNVGTVLHLPLPHAVLVARRQWRQWTLPFLNGTERRGHSYHLGTPLWSATDHADDDTVVNLGESFGPDDMLQIADVLRNCLRYVPQSSAVLCETIKHHCRVLKTMRDSLVVQTVQLLQHKKKESKSGF